MIGEATLFKRAEEIEVGRRIMQPRLDARSDCTNCKSAPN